MRNPREVLATASSAAKRFEVKASKRQLVTTAELTGGSLALAMLLGACSPKGQEFITPTPPLKPTLTPKPTAIPTEGPNVVDLYDTTGVEKINLESFQRIDTQDGLNPNILTAKDTDGNTYAYNPEHGWFKVPEVYNPMISFDWDRMKLEDGPSPTAYLLEINNQINPEHYPIIEEDFVTDGRFNITQALYYQNLPENQKISTESARGQYWISYDWGGQILDVGLFPAGNGGYAFINYPEEFNNTNYVKGGKLPPFIFSGLWKVRLNNGEYSYAIGTTQRNPTETNPNQLINLAYGFDQESFENSTKIVEGAGNSNLTASLAGVIWGGNQLSIIVRPPRTTTRWICSTF